MQAEDIIRIKEIQANTKTVENEMKQQSLYNELLKLLKIKMLTPSDQTCDLLQQLINRVRNR